MPGGHFHTRLHSVCHTAAAQMTPDRQIRWRGHLIGKTSQERATTEFARRRTASWVVVRAAEHQCAGGYPRRTGAYIAQELMISRESAGLPWPHAPRRMP